MHQVRRLANLPVSFRSILELVDRSFRASFLISIFNVGLESIQGVVHSQGTVWMRPVRSMIATHGMLLSVARESVGLLWWLCVELPSIDRYLKKICFAPPVTHTIRFSTADRKEPPPLDDRKVVHSLYEG